MRKLIVLERITLDGVFDATSMGKWDIPFNSEARMAVIAGGIHSSDAYLLGRVTYEMLWPGWSALKNNEHGIADKLNSMKKYVVSSTLEKTEWNSRLVKDDLAEEVTKLKKQGGKDLLIMNSSSIAQECMKHGLIDEYWLTIHPVTLGEGLPLFKERVNLKLLDSKIYNSGQIFLHYATVRG